MSGTSERQMKRDLVGEDERAGVDAIGAKGRWRRRRKPNRPWRAIPRTGRGGAAGDDDEPVGVMEGEMESLDGGDGGFAPLAGATEEEAEAGGVRMAMVGVGARRRGESRPIARW